MSRIDKINQQLKREISGILQRDLEDPRLAFVTIIQASVSRDLRHAKVHYSVLGNAQQTAAAQEGLASARGLIRKFIGQRMTMRYTPELTFTHDQSVEMSARIDAVLREIHHEPS